MGVALLAVGGVACQAAAPSENIGVAQTAATAADGYCRSTNCNPGPAYPQQDETGTWECEPPGWSELCQEGRVPDPDNPGAFQDPRSNAPLWWRTACVGFDINATETGPLGYCDVLSATHGAFDAWTIARCPSAAGSLPPSIDDRDLGPVCGTPGYDPNGPNQNVIVFDDRTWTRDPSIAAVTTVTSDVETGEIVDADIEINAVDHCFSTTLSQTPCPDPDEGLPFDLQSVLTHEIGHFFGLAHSPLADAVMYYSGDTDQGGMKRVLTPADIAGICAIYPADGTRSVATLVSPSGYEPEAACDPTPKGGFATQCPDGTSFPECSL